MRRNRRGFSFVELMTVLLVLSILSGLAILRYIDLKHHAISTKALGDLRTVRLAAYHEFYDSGNWPGDAGPGDVPPELVSYLGSGFTFTRPEYTLDWMSLPPGGAFQVGVSVTSSNARLMAVLTRSLGNKHPFVVMGDQLTLIIVGPDGQS